MKLRLATWNIRKCIGLDRRRDPHRTARVIRELQADIVALQEADRRLGQRPAALRAEMVEAETGLVPVDAGGHEPSIGWHGNALLVSRQAQVLDCHGLHLPGIEPRGALIVDLRIDGRDLRCVATHLGFLRRYRRQQMATIRTYIDNLPQRPTAILGDFNEWSPHHGLEPLSDFSVCAPGRSFHAARPVAPLDRIATDAAWTVRASSVVETRETRVASDHLPVWADVTVR